MTMQRSRLRPPVIPMAAPPVPTLYLSDLAALNLRWWPGIPTRCTRLCGGRLWVSFPDQYAVGSLACLLCSVAVAFIALHRPEVVAWPERETPNAPCIECDAPRPPGGWRTGRRCPPCFRPIQRARMIARRKQGVLDAAQASRRIEQCQQCAARPARPGRHYCRDCRARNINKEKNR